MNTEQVACPVCGKQHTVTRVTQPKKMYLDMVPKYNMQEYFSAYVVCDCGMLCFNKANELPTPAKLLALPRYQDALAITSEVDERKLMVMTYGLQYQWAPIYAAHFYAQMQNDEKREKWLNIALQRAQEGYDYNARIVEPAYFEALKLKNTLFDTRFVYTTNHQYIELYRQLGRFEDAMELCNQMETTKISSHERTWLAYEKQLIQKKNKSTC